MDAHDATPIVFEIQGMHCGGCVRGVAAALAGVDGVAVDVVEVGRAVCRVAAAQRQATVQRAVQAIVDAGFLVVGSP